MGCLWLEVEDKGTEGLGAKGCIMSFVWMANRKGLLQLYLLLFESFSSIDNMTSGADWWVGLKIGGWIELLWVIIPQKEHPCRYGCKCELKLWW